MKTMIRLAMVAAACLSSGAAHAVTYTLSDQDAKFVNFSWQTENPITQITTITDFGGQPCQVGDQYLRLACTSLTINPTYYDDESNYRAETILLMGTFEFTTVNSSVNLPVGSLSTNGIHTEPYRTLRLTVADIRSPTSPAAAVPEPATWALMLAGFGLTATALRRRRVRFARVSA